MSSRIQFVSSRKRLIPFIEDAPTKSSEGRKEGTHAMITQDCNHPLRRCPSFRADNKNGRYVTVGAAVSIEAAKEDLRDVVSK